MSQLRVLGPQGHPVIETDARSTGQWSTKSQRRVDPNMERMLSVPSEGKSKLRVISSVIPSLCGAAGHPRIPQSQVPMRGQPYKAQACLPGNGSRKQFCSTPYPSLNLASVNTKLPYLRISGRHSLCGANLKTELTRLQCLESFQIGYHGTSRQKPPNQV